MNELQVDSVLLSFDNINQLLTDCYMNCRTGDIIGILGRNGSGKSSLMKIIFGTLIPLNKCIRINGTVYNKPYQSKLIGYLPQHGFLPSNSLVEQVIDVMIQNATNRTSVKGDSRIKNKLKQKVNTLSGGERRYLEVLLVVQLDALFVLLDEPFSGIEPIYKEMIKEVISDAKKDKGIILTDHDYRNIIQISTQIMLITNGVSRNIANHQELEALGYVPAGTFEH
ncbi:ABC-type multidrug transport system, ATPase component [Olivibacter domesticus]|uniref:ABC-type multidrug transport system, ATPase component n=2 Tax=Olivibacter domesticus TaxID=407022 RepID=A0A1H7LUR8_OLID1|nr:ABC-type multidrug transport system, ATPase component [Olivibacter domesticus]